MDALAIEDVTCCDGGCAAWRYLARQFHTTPELLREPGFRVIRSAPLSRPYFHTSEPLFAAFHHGPSVTVAAGQGFVGFARAWHHHLRTPGQACQPDELRWLRQNLSMAGAKLHALAQFVLLPSDFHVPHDLAIQRLRQSDRGLLVTELGWLEEDAAEAIAHGLYAAFVGDRLACHVVTYHLAEQVAEVGVRTLPEFRGRGLASATVQTVAAELLGDHAAVFYTCELTDTASQAVAHRIGAHFLGELLLAVTAGE
jgi:GNAT superfamily N-acetyltransferase